MAKLTRHPGCNEHRSHLTDLRVSSLFMGFRNPALYAVTISPASVAQRVPSYRPFSIFHFPSSFFPLPSSLFPPCLRASVPPVRQRMKTIFSLLLSATPLLSQQVPPESRVLARGPEDNLRETVAPVMVNGATQLDFSFPTGSTPLAYFTRLHSSTLNPSVWSSGELCEGSNTHTLGVVHYRLQW